MAGDTPLPQLLRCDTAVIEIPLRGENGQTPGGEIAQKGFALNRKAAVPDEGATLLSASSARTLLDADGFRGGGRPVILEVSYGKPGGGCIPGAVGVHPSYFESFNDTARYCPAYSHPDHAKLLPAAELGTAIAALGITRDTCVIVYGAGRIVPMTAARVAWALMYAGVREVRILDGGFTAWVAGGNPVADDLSPPLPSAGFGAAVPARPDYLATADDVAAVVEGKNPRGLLVDVRSREEYDGTNTNTYPFFSKAGHIPGAVWMGDWTGLVNGAEDTFAPLPALKERWTALGIEPGREIIFYCGTGWRSAIAFWLARLMGYPAVKNYDGGFFDWSWNAARPVSTLLRRG